MGGNWKAYSKSGAAEGQAGFRGCDGQTPRGRRQAGPTSGAAQALEGPVAEAEAATRRGTGATAQTTPPPSPHE